MGAIRTFIALELKNSDLINKLEALSKELGQVGGIKPVGHENLHITIKFLGNVEEETAKKIARFLHEKVNSSIFPNGEQPLEIVGVGSFRLNVIFANIGVGVDLVAKIFREVEDGLAENFKIPREPKAFHPHITLARVKYLQGEAASRLKAILRVYENTSFGKSMVDGVVLKKSQLTPKGPIYSDVSY